MLNTDSVRTDLIDAVRDVFAEMAFLDILEYRDPPEGYQSVSGPWASIEIRGELSGTVVLMLPLELKKTLIESIYATPWDELTLDRKDDGLLEVLNVLAGRFLSIRRSGKGLNKLSIPEVVFDSEDLPGYSPEMDLLLDAEGTPFRVQIYQEVIP